MKKVQILAKSRVFLIDLEQINTEITAQITSFEGKFSLLDGFLERISRFSSKLAQIHQRNKEKTERLAAQTQYFQSELVSKQREFAIETQELREELKKTREESKFLSNTKQELEETYRKTKAEYIERIHLMENRLRESVESYEKQLKEEKDVLIRRFSADNTADKSQISTLRAEIQALIADKLQYEQQFTVQIAEIRSESEIQIRATSDTINRELVNIQNKLSSVQGKVTHSESQLQSVISTCEKQRKSICDYRNLLADCINFVYRDCELGPEMTVEALIHLLKELWSEKVAVFISETDSIKQENSLLVQKIQRVTLENEFFSLQLERKTAEIEDYQSAFFLGKDTSQPINRISLGLDSQSEWEQEREALLQQFAREKLELLASLEAENQFLKSKTAAVKPQIFLAEEQMSDVEVQRLSESVEIAIDQAAGPNRAFYTLFRAVSSYAETEKIAIDDAISSIQQSLLAGKPAAPCLFSANIDRETQTESKYREFASYLSMEEEISAVGQGVCHGESLEQSFVKATNALFDGKELTPSFDISRGQNSDQSLSICSPERQLQGESEENQAVVAHYRRLEKDLEEEIRTCKQLQQQVLLLREEISQKDRQLERLSEAKPQMNGEVIADAFGKLVRTLPHL